MSKRFLDKLISFVKQDDENPILEYAKGKFRQAR